MTTNANVVDYDTLLEMWFREYQEFIQSELDEEGIQFPITIEYSDGTTLTINEEDCK